MFWTNWAFDQSFSVPRMSTSSVHLPESLSTDVSLGCVSFLSNLRVCPSLQKDLKQPTWQNSALVTMPVFVLTS